MGVLEWWQAYREKKQEQRQKASMLAELIERMVQDSDPSIRKVSGYRRRLRGPVETALAYIEALISSIPGPYGLFPGYWHKDPLIHALFVNSDELRSLLRNSADLKSFFQQSGMETAVALLTATRRERTVLGTTQEGGILRRDVPQVAVEFLDHQVVAPVATEERLRRELVQRGLNLLAIHTLEEIVRIHSIREELSEERRMLALKLKIQHGRESGLDRLLAGESRRNAGATEARQLLEEIDKQLMELDPGSGGPEDFLGKLAAVLLGPGQYLTGKMVGMRLNWMGIRLEEDAIEAGGDIRLAELEMPGRQKRVAVLATVSADECLGKQ
jgi:hypothetical protein